MQGVRSYPQVAQASDYICSIHTIPISSIFNFLNKNGCEYNALHYDITAVWCQVMQGLRSYPQVAQASDSRWSDKGAVQHSSNE